MITIELVISPENDTDVVKVIDKVINLATGFALDKIDVDINISHWDQPEKEDENDPADS